MCKHICFKCKKSFSSYEEFKEHAIKTHRNSDYIVNNIDILAGRLADQVDILKGIVGEAYCIPIFMECEEFERVTEIVDAVYSKIQESLVSATEEHNKDK